MSAPERIWADRKLIYPCSQGMPGATEFVRADIHEAEVLRLRADARAKDAEIARLRALSIIVRNNIPMDILARHDAPGATGPTDALDLASAVREYAEQRWTQRAEIEWLQKALGNLRDAIMSEDMVGDRDLTITGSTASLKWLTEALEDARVALGEIP